jgi:hypothetical protein
MDTRLRRVKWDRGNPRLRTSVANWKQPFYWDREAAQACLADVFDQEVPDEWRMDLFDVISNGNGKRLFAGWMPCSKSKPIFRAAAFYFAATLRRMLRKRSALRGLRYRLLCRSSSNIGPRQEM